MRYSTDIFADLSRILRNPRHFMLLSRYILPAFASTPQSEGSSSAASLPPSSDPVSVTRSCHRRCHHNWHWYPVFVTISPKISCNLLSSRTFCGALFFPTIATFLGSTLFEEVQHLIEYYIYTGVFCYSLKFIIPGPVAIETSCDGWFLLCGSKGSS